MREDHWDDDAVDAAAHGLEEDDDPPGIQRPPLSLVTGRVRPDVEEVSWPGGLDDQHDAAMWLFGSRDDQGRRVGGRLPHARWSPLHDAWMVLQDDATWRPMPEAEMLDLATAQLRRARTIKRNREGEPVKHPDGGDVLIPMRLTDSKVAGVLAFARRHWGVKQKDGSSEWPPPPGVPFRDGMLLEPDGQTIRPIRPSDAVTHRLPCDAPTTEATPLLDAWARSAWGGELWTECLTVYLRWLGATLLWEGTLMHRALYLYGLRGRGKSVLLKVTEDLFPPALVSNVEPGAVGNFDAEPLAKAQVNVCDDLTKAERWAEGAFKTAVTGGLLRIDRKFRPQVAVRPRAGWIMGGNIPPDLRDPAVSRRVVLLYFGGKEWIGKGKSAAGIVRNLHEQIVKTEGGALVLRAIRAHLARVNEDLVTPDAFAHFIEEAERLNPVHAFVEDHLPPDPSAKDVRRSDVYEAYKAYCARNGNRPLAAQSFAPALGAEGIYMRETNGSFKVVGRRLIQPEPEMGPSQAAAAQGYFYNQD